MQCYLYGTIWLEGATKEICNQFKAEANAIFDTFYDAADDFIINCSRLELFGVTVSYPEDALKDITSWFKEHGATIETGTQVSYDGDCNGACRYLNGRWITYDSDAIIDMTDESLIEELQYRGYIVKKQNGEDTAVFDPRALV